jgi:hypothetical protein
MNSIYRSLVQNPPKLEIVENATKVIFNMVSCMCDNRSQIVISGNYISSKLDNGLGYSMSNYQMECTTEDLKWEVEDGNWDKVIEMINSGTARIESVKSKA